MQAQSIIHSDPEILSGWPVFVGTRVPVDALFDTLEAGENLEEFLDGFPSVERDQVIALLELMRDYLNGSAEQQSAEPQRERVTTT